VQWNIPLILIAEVGGILQAISITIIENVVEQGRIIKHLCPHGGFCPNGGFCLGFVGLESSYALHEFAIIGGKSFLLGGDGPVALGDDEWGAFNGGYVDEEEVAGTGGIELSCTHIETSVFIQIPEGSLGCQGDNIPYPPTQNTHPSTDYGNYQNPPTNNCSQYRLSR